MKHLILLLILSVNILPVASQKAVDKETVLKKVHETDAYVRQVRGYLHENPEISGKEFETAKYIQAELEKMGLPVTKVRGTGLYAILDTKRQGKTIGLRADIDALPIPENPENLKQKKKWISKNEGVSHACGHDGHVAILLGAAKILSELKDRLSGKYIFIFEEGEETIGGIDAMIEALKPLKIDAIYGNHLKSNIPTGQLFIREGAIMAGTGAVAMDIIGRGGHASRPDLSINPVFAAANILTGISIAWNNQRDITKTVTLGITQIEGSNIYNVIPNKAFIGGTIRFFDRDEADKCYDVMKKVAENIAAAHDCTVQLHDRHKIHLPPVINDNNLTKFTQGITEEILPGRVVTDEKYIWYAAESFTRYSELAPTVFVFPGILNESLGSGAEHHNDRFDIDEDALQYAVTTMVWFGVRASAGK